MPVEIGPGKFEFRALTDSKAHAGLCFARHVDRAVAGEAGEITLDEEAQSEREKRLTLQTVKRLRVFVTAQRTGRLSLCLRNKKHHDITTAAFHASAKG